MPSRPRIFEFDIFLSVALSALGCIFTWRLSSRIRNSVFMLFIHLVFFFSFFFFCYDLSVPIFLLKNLFSSLSHPVVGMASPILPLLVGRIFCCCFGTSCFVCIVWSCLGIFLSLLSFASNFWLVSSSFIFRFSWRVLFFFQFRLNTF